MSGCQLLRDGALAELRLNNPAKGNALTPQMLDDIVRHCDDLEKMDGTRAVLVTAAGTRAFCVGADIGAWSDLDPARFARDWVRSGHRVFDRLAGLSLPTIAVLSASAMGGGLELAAACDIRLMSPNAELSLPEAAVGVVPGWSGTQRLARLLPEPVLKEMALFGRKISAQRAHALGFAAEIADDARAAAVKIAGGLATISARSVDVAKQMIHCAAGEDRAALTEALGGAVMAATEDKNEGVAAFFDKRAPRFAGK